MNAVWIVGVLWFVWVTGALFWLLSVLNRRRPGAGSTTTGSSTST
jgi:hypothetical protein